MVNLILNHFQQAYHAATVIRQMQRMALSSSGGSSGRSPVGNRNNSDENSPQCINGSGVTK